MDINRFLNLDCIEYMKSMPNNSVDMTLTDVPYGAVCRETNGLKKISNLDNIGVADLETFSLKEFCKEVYRITKNSVVIFCGREQFSTVADFFGKKKGTTRTVVWIKSNPVPSNGQYVYLSGIELAVWFKKSGGKNFNAYCKNPVFTYPIPSGKKRIHKTQKHWDLWKELILDNSAEGDLIFDPCAGSGITALVSKENKRNFLCLELDKETYDKSLVFLQKYKVFD